MGRPKGAPTKTVTTVLSRATYDQIHEQAQQRGLTTSSHVRNVLETMFPGNQPSPLAILQPEADKDKQSA